VNSATILLVEDNPDDVALTLRALKSHKIGNEVVVLEDGEQAPKVTGLEVLQRIRADERTRVLPVVVFTSSGEERDVV
jgi:two-component system, response regulator